jgi:hypothetical protein
MAYISITSPSPFVVGVHPVSLGNRLLVDQDVADRLVGRSLAVEYDESDSAGDELDARRPAAVSDDEPSVVPAKPKSKPARKTATTPAAGDQTTTEVK